MTGLRLLSIVVAGSTVLSAACASPRPESLSDQIATSPARESRVLTFPVTREVTSLYPEMNTAGGTAATHRLFNAGLAVVDDGGNIRPELAEIPQFDTDSWRVLPDGKMETIYRLKPGLAWHDGQPLEAEDYVFAKRVYGQPGVEITRPRPERLMESVVASDPTTLLIRWRSPYPGANALVINDFDPLPRHILGEAFARVEHDAAQAAAFNNLPYWKSEYVGTGPYRLVAWEAGSHFEGAAFDRFALGKPRIDRVIHKLMDDTVVITNILAGTLDMGQMNYEHYGLLESDWARSGKGTLLIGEGNVQPNEIQLRPEYVGHPGLLDVRVRRALAHTIDRQALNDGTFDGRGIMVETIVPPRAPNNLNEQVERAIMRYPYDARRAEQLMGEAGFTKDRDGFFADSSGQRFTVDFERNRASDRERLQLIMVDTWKRAGFEVRPYELPVGEPPREARYTFPGIQGQGSATEGTWATVNIGTAQNRWTGNNRSGFSHAEYDRLYDAFGGTLDQPQRTQQFIGMMRIYSEHLPTFITHFSLNSWAVASHLKGVKNETKPIGELTVGTIRYFNIHEWEWQ
jgi:peptide/nickel transport system substrate-binding protein